MSRDARFSWSRWWGIVIKELLQLRRDRMTFAMIVGIPVMQLLLFGYAINSDPRHLPTALVLGEQTPLVRSIESSLSNTEYFAIKGRMDDASAREALVRGDVHFVITFPAGFSRSVLRGEKPSLLVEADASDPTATGGALAALQGVVQSVAARDFYGSLRFLKNDGDPFSFHVHRKFNPEGLTRYNIVPGLMGVILTLTTVMITGLSITRERERGTLENLLASPVTPLEIMTGKIVPHVLIGHVQIGLILLLSRLLFGVPFQGNPLALYVSALLFIAVNLIVGVTLSSLAKNQLQSMQMTMFYFLPSMMLSGFMFPFAGMPQWAQSIGRLLPLTYFNRSVRGVLLKGAGWADVWPNIWPVALFGLVVLLIASRLFHRTLD